MANEPDKTVLNPTPIVEIGNNAPGTSMSLNNQDPFPFPDSPHRFDAAVKSSPDEDFSGQKPEEPGYDAGAAGPTREAVSPGPNPSPIDDDRGPNVDPHGYKRGQDRAVFDNPAKGFKEFEFTSTGTEEYPAVDTPPHFVGSEISWPAPAAKAEGADKVEFIQSDGDPAVEQMKLYRKPGTSHDEAVRVIMQAYLAARTYGVDEYPEGALDDYPHSQPYEPTNTAESTPAKKPIKGS